MRCGKRFGAGALLALSLAIAAAGTSHRVAAQVQPPAPANPAAAAHAKSTGQVAAVDPESARPDGGSKAIAKVKDAASRAIDIFRRVPCLPSKGSGKGMVSLPHVAGRLAANEPVVIVAFGSSSTEGYGATSPEFTYPHRLAAQLRRRYPEADITVLNRGRGGEDAAEMMARLKRAVIDAKPDLVIWQVGTNAILRNIEAAKAVALVEKGVARIQRAGADVVLVGPQYVPKVNAKGESASRMASLLGRIAGLRHVGIFPRFEVMREWHEQRALAFDRFSIADGLHMNDWGYACFAQLLGDDIIKSVEQARRDITRPPGVVTYRPM